MRVAANCWYSSETFTKQLLLRTLQQGQWIVPVVEHPVHSLRQVCLELRKVYFHISKLELLKKQLWS